MSQSKIEEFKLENSWKEKLIPEFKKTYMIELNKFLQTEIAKKKIIFPRHNEYFAALNATPFDKVKVVLLGQDPYHGPGQAHGLCFSVQPEVRFPPSLQNIFKELKADIGVNPPKTGFLTSWAEQGVLMLNSVLTVEHGQAASHKDKGWEIFTDKIISLLNDECENLVFILWGAYAQKKGAFVDRKKHLVLEGPHPSPLSAHRGFFGTKPFSKVNTYLKNKGVKPIDWNSVNLDV